MSKNFTITVSNIKGGIGKTTLAMVLATGLASKGYKVLAVDADPQSNLTDYFLPNVETVENNCLIQALEGTKEISECIWKTDYENLFVLPSDVALAGTIYRLSDKGNLMFYQMFEKEPVNRDSEDQRVYLDYDFIIIDTAAAMNTMLYNAFSASDMVICPTAADKKSIKGILQTIQTCADLTRSMPSAVRKKLVFKVICNQLNRNKIEKEEISQLREMLGDRLMQTTIRFQAKPLKEADKRGVVVTQLAYAVSQEYKDFVDEIEREVR